MVFTSWIFLVFITVFLVAFRFCPNRTSRQALILVASLVFYAWWSPVFLLLLATPSIIDYICASRIDASDDPRHRKRILLVSLVTNLGLLAYFKYTNFFLDTIYGLAGVPHRALDITLPVGISFFTFKALSYTIDVYRKEIPVCHSWWRFAMFITYFPELVAGPIVRASVFLPQLSRNLKFSWTRLMLGLQICLVGVTKKLFIADRLAIFVDPVFADPQSYSPFTIASAIVAYSLQIYCDFSGYSDIAIGVSRVIGYDLPENFNMPYVATSLSDFWKRWHITLSQWLRDYLYIPLGGNRKGPHRTYFNLMATMLLGGLWHGANWTFVIWGCLHGLGLAVSHAYPGKTWNTWPRLQVVVNWLLTYCYVCLCWVFFRAESFTDAMTILRKLALLDQTGMVVHYSPLYLLLPIVIVGHMLGLLAARQYRLNPYRALAASWLKWLYGQQRFAVKPHSFAGIFIILPPQPFLNTVLVTIWVLMLVLLSPTETSPFIYFQF